MDTVTYKPADNVKESVVADKEETYDVGIDGECPICARHRDPVTGEEQFNAETIAAIEEGRAVMRGEIPAKWYDNVEDFLADLKKDDDEDDD